MKKPESKCYSYVRFSTPQQVRGDSLSRQLELSEKYARDHGLNIDTSLSLKDLGISAFKGEHTTKGALGQFIELINNGEINKGSILLVESLDRLSREQVLDAFEQFTSIIKQGVKIVTLTDQIEYSEETLNANIGQLMISLTIMARAHEESLIKSKRLKSAWKRKRENIHKEKLTAKCPGWLILDKKNQEFTIIKERTDLIHRIFKMYMDGTGTEKICKQINKEQIAPWGRSKKGWYKSYIQKILHNKALIGEFQPKKLNGKKYENAGEPVKNYYPVIIKNSLFYNVQSKLKSNTKYKGKTGTISNLFAHIAKCGHCNSPMQFVNKGPSPKGGKYLVCDSARRGLGCKYFSINYNKFEKTFLSCFRELNFDDILPSTNSNKQQKIQKMKTEIGGLEGNLSEVNSNINNLLSSLKTTDDENVQKFINEELSVLLNSKNIIEHDILDADRKLQELSNLNEYDEIAFNELKAILENISNIKDDKIIEIRRRIRGQIRRLIDEILFTHYGLIMEQEDIKKYGWKRYRNDWYAHIYFKNGNYRSITPTSDGKEHTMRSESLGNGKSYLFFKDHQGNQIVDARDSKTEFSGEIDQQMAIYEYEQIKKMFTKEEWKIFDPKDEY